MSIPERDVTYLVLLQRGRIDCNAKRCNSYGNSVRSSVRHTLVLYPEE